MSHGPARRRDRGRWLPAIPRPRASRSGSDHTVCSCARAAPFCVVRCWAAFGGRTKLAQAERVGDTVDDQAAAPAAARGRAGAPAVLTDRRDRAVFELSEGGASARAHRSGAARDVVDRHQCSRAIGSPAVLVHRGSSCGRPPSPEKFGPATKVLDSSPLRTPQRGEAALAVPTVPAAREHRQPTRKRFALTRNMEPTPRSGNLRDGGPRPAKTHLTRGAPTIWVPS
jgi:hypothetical protein